MTTKIPHERPPAKDPSAFKKLCTEKTCFIDTLTDELLVHIASFLTPIDLYHKFPKLYNHRIYQISLEYNKDNETYKQWWKEHCESDFPNSLLDNQLPWSSLYKYEFVAKQNMLRGEFKKSSLFHVQHLTALHQQEHFLLTHSTTNISGWDIASKTFLFSIVEIISAYTTYQNTLYAFMGDNRIQCYALTPTEVIPYQLLDHQLNFVPVQGQNNCIKEAKVFWPYLVGFTKDTLHVWNLKETPANPQVLPIESKDFIGVYHEKLIYLKDHHLMIQNHVDNQPYEPSFPSGYFSHPNNIHQFGHDLLVCLSDAKNAQLIWVINLLTLEKNEISLNHPIECTATCIYADSLYYWHEELGVVATLSLKAFKKKDIPQLATRQWNTYNAPTNNKVMKGSRFKLINGLIFTRTHVLDLTKNLLVDIGNTVCEHQHYTLDYSKVTYFDGRLVRGYRCGNDSSNVHILDFNNPDENPQVTTDPMNLS